LLDVLGYCEIIPLASTEQPEAVNKCQEAWTSCTRDTQILKQPCGSSDRQTDRWNSKNLVLMWWYSWTKRAAPTQPEVSQTDYKMQGMHPPTCDSKFPFVLLKKNSSFFSI